MTKNTMRAISQDTLGEPDVLQEVELDRPEPGGGQVLVAVHAAGVNPTDWMHRRLGLHLGEPPFTLGWDVSGVVEAVGFGVSLFKPGDEVMGMLPYPYGAGSHAEYVAGPARAFVPKPAALSHVEAGALALAALTAWQALVDNARVQPGQRVLVHAAAGGVGHLAVQIAKARGAYVIATASAAQHDLPAELGVDEAVDYRSQKFEDVVQPVDVVYDLIGGDVAERSLDVLHPDGIQISLPSAAAAVTVEAAKARGLHAVGMMVEPDGDGLEELAALVEAGTLQVLVDWAFPLAEAADAHHFGEAGRPTGKIVLVV